MNTFSKVLVLNSDFRPIKIVSWKSAICSVIKNNAFALDEQLNRYTFDKWFDYTLNHHEELTTNKIINCAKIKVHVPFIILLRNFNKIYKREPRITKKNIWERDKKRCVYCGKYLKLNEATIDHVIPQSKGGKNVWENCVCCCKKCNSIKSDKSVKMLGWTINTQMKPPSEYCLFKIKYGCEFEKIPEIWKNFLKLS